MALDATQRLRRMVGDRIPPGGNTDGTDTFFSNEEITDLIEEAEGNLNVAAYAGWTAKMAEYAEFVDIDESGSTRRLSQLYKNAALMQAHYGKFMVALDAALVGRVVGRAVSLRETSCNPVQTGSGTFRSELHNERAREIMRNSHPEVAEADETYPQPGAVAGA